MTKDAPTKQEMFDIAVKGIKRQKDFGVNSAGNCSYLSSDGTMCGVGQILGKTYCKKWIASSYGLNESPVSELGAALKLTHGNNSKFKLHPALSKENIIFLTAIQKAHDEAAQQSYTFVDLDVKLRNVAKRYKLDTTVLDKAKLGKQDQ